MAARWVDANRGVAAIRAINRDKARMIGVHNGFLSAAFDSKLEPGDNVYWRNLHAIVSSAPGYLFDRSRRGCWACIFQVGETSDVILEEGQPSSTKP